MSAKLLLAGCGKMGSAMLAGWLDRGVAPGDVTIVEPSIAYGDDLKARYGVSVVNDADDIDSAFKPDVIIFAVKPQVMDAVVPAYTKFSDSGAVFLSIAAGRTIASFVQVLGAAPIVRAMPNTPAAIQKGITVCCPNDKVSPQQQRQCHELLEAIGEVAWVDDEALIDPVTAVSGSGPAYIFLLAEAMAAAGEKAGLPADLSAKLARATVAGAGCLLGESAEDAATLRHNVTSPNGTTAAALEVFMDEVDGWQKVVDRAIQAATNRSRELAS